MAKTAKVSRKRATRKIPAGDWIAELIQHDHLPEETKHLLERDREAAVVATVWQLLEPLMDECITIYRPEETDSRWLVAAIEFLKLYVKVLEEENIPPQMFEIAHRLNHMLTLPNQNSEAKAVKQLLGLHPILARLNISSLPCETLVTKLTKIVGSPHYLGLMEGRRFITLLFTLNVKLVKIFHEEIKRELPLMKIQKAVQAYGDIYYKAWEMGNKEIKKEIEVKCIQNLMKHAFQFPRNGQERTKLAQHVFIILNAIHARRYTLPFSKVITDLYLPLLWRYLKSGNNIERCNAGEILLDVFPLESVAAGRAEYYDFLDQQYKAIDDLLTDDCPTIRIIAIKGICNNLRSVWDSWSKPVVNGLVRKMITVLANDSSSADVRRAVFVGLTHVLDAPQAASLLANILPLLTNHLHDVSDRVRKAFINMLLKMKEIKSAGSYLSVSPIKHLESRLALDKKDIGKLIVQLIKDEYIIMKPENETSLNHTDTMSCIVNLSVMNPIAARKLIMYLDLSLEHAWELIVCLLAKMKHVIRKHISSGVERAAEFGKMKRLKRRRMPLREYNADDTANAETTNESGSNTSQSDSSPGSEAETDIWMNPDMCRGLVDCAAALWIVKSPLLHLPDNEDKLERLYRCIVSHIGTFLLHFKGTHTYYSLVHLASLVPLARLTPVSTIAGACISELKCITESTPVECIKCLVHSLCAWRRGCDIIDMVREWIDQAFRSEELNESAMPVVGSKRSKVRFAPVEVKPMLALRILDITFDDEISKDRILTKSYGQLTELCDYLKRIQVLVERRLSAGSPLNNPQLADVFLEECLARYLKLTVLLHLPSPLVESDLQPVCKINSFSCILDWAERIIVPVMPEDISVEEGTPVSLLYLQQMVKIGVIVVGLNYTNKTHVQRIVTFMKSLLQKGCGLWFVEDVIQFVRIIVEHAEAYHDNDDWKIFDTMAPTLLTECLRVLSVRSYALEDFSHCIRDFHKLKMDLIVLPKALFKMFVKTNPELPLDIMIVFVDACIGILSHSITKENSIKTFNYINEMPISGKLILSSILSASSLVKQFSVALNHRFVNDYSKNDFDLLAAVSLLHTLVHMPNKFPQVDMPNLLQAAYKAVKIQHSPINQSFCELSDNSFITSNNVNLRKLAEQIIIEASKYREAALAEAVV